MKLDSTYVLHSIAGERTCISNYVLMTHDFFFKYTILNKLAGKCFIVVWFLSSHAALLICCFVNQYKTKKE